MMTSSKSNSDNCITVMSTPVKMSSTDKSNKDMIRMYYISYIQQSYQVALLFQSSHRNSDENNNGIQLHSSETMLHEFSNKVFEYITTDLHNIIPDFQPNFEQIEIDSLINNSSGNANSQPTQKSHFPVPELDLSNLPTFVPHHQLNLEQIGQEAPAAASLKETVTNLALSISQSLIENHNCKDSFSRSVKKQNNVERKKPKLRQKYVCNMPDSEKLGNSTIRQLKNHLLLHKKIYDCAHCDKRFTRKDYLAVHVRKHMNFKRSKCQCPNCSAEGGNQIKGPDGRLQHVCHILNCRKVFSETWHLKKHLVSHDAVMIHKRLKCQCPNCSVEGGNKTRGPDGRSIHACHIPDCGKVYIETWHLKKHLISHKRKGNSVRQRRNSSFMHKDESGEHNRKQNNSAVNQSLMKEPTMSSEDEFYGFPEAMES